MRAPLIAVPDINQRRRDGIIPAAPMINQTVLEWRVAPASGAADPTITSLDRSHCRFLVGPVTSLRGPAYRP
jgi:hypothetical protein